MRPRVQYLLNCYTGENIIGASENGERSLESEDCVNRTIHPLQSAVSVLPVFENPNANRRNVQLDFEQRQRIRNLAKKLKNSADSLDIRPRSDSLTIEQAILANKNLNKDEMQVVRNILSENLPTNVSRVAEHLGKYMTSRTFRAALEYLCFSASSAPEELKIACELVKASYPTIRKLTRANSVYEVINEFIEEKLDEVLH